MRRRISWCLLLTLLLLALSPGTAFMAARKAWAPKDLRNHWAAPYVAELQVLGAIEGYADGMFRPDRPVTRAEFVTLLNRTAQLEPTPYAGSFADIPPGAWFGPQVATAVAAGYAAGFGNGTFGPDQPVTRYEAAAILSRALGLPEAPLPLWLGDKPLVPGWARLTVGAVLAAGLMEGYPDETFGGQRPLTRAEAGALMLRARGRLLASVARPLAVELADDYGRPVAGAWVRVHSRGEQQVLDEAQTSTSGLAQFWLRPAAYDVTAATADRVGYRSMILGTASARLRLPLQQAAVISGRILDDQGRPQPGALVALTANPTYLTRTDADGNYQAAVLGGLRYRLSLGNQGSGAGFLDLGAGVPPVPPGSNYDNGSLQLPGSEGEIPRHLPGLGDLLENQLRITVPVTAMANTRVSGTVTVPEQLTRDLGVRVSLSSGADRVVSPTRSVLVERGQRSSSFDIHTYAVDSDTAVTLTATVGEVSATAQITVQPDTVHGPVITGFSPSEGRAGDPIVVTGNNLGSPEETTLAGYPTNRIDVTDTQATIYVPRVAPDGTSGPLFYRTRLGSTTSSQTFTIRGPGPYIARLSPENVVPDPLSRVTVEGDELQDVTAVTLGDHTFTVTDSADRLITIAVPLSTPLDLSGPLTITTPAGTATSAQTLTIARPPAPVITAFWPPAGPPGTPITVTGQHLIYDGTAQVAIGGQETWHLSMPLPEELLVWAGTQSGPISLTTPGGTGASGTDFIVIPLTPPTGVHSLWVRPGELRGGDAAAATVILDGTNDGPLEVSLSTDSQDVINLPATAAVRRLQGSGEFVVTANAVSAPTPVTINATYGGVTRTAALTVQPSRVRLLSLNAANLTGGTGVSGQVELEGTAPAGGALVSMSSDNPAVTLPAAVTVPEGAIRAAFEVTTAPVPAGVSATLTAAYGGASESAGLQVMPRGAHRPVPSAISPASGPTGSYITITGSDLHPVTAVEFAGQTLPVSLNGGRLITARLPHGIPIGTSGPITVLTPLGSAVTADLFTVDPPPAPVITSVSPRQGQWGLYVYLYGSNLTHGDPQVTQISFNGTPSEVLSFSSPTELRTYVPGRSTTGPITVATPGGTAVSEVFTVFDNQTPSELWSLELSQPEVTGGRSVTATLALTSFAREPGVTVALSSSDPAVLAPPATHLIRTGFTSDTFELTPAPVTAPTDVQITATSQGISRSATLRVLPAAMAEFTVVAGVVTAGHSVMGRVTLTGPAPATGVSVAIRSSDSTVLWAPASVSIPAGADSVLVPLQTGQVQQLSQAQVTAEYGGGSRTVTVSVMPISAATPAITSMSPEGAPAGGVVELRGTNLFPAESVTLEGIPLRIHLNGGDVVSVRIPPGTVIGTSGPIVVATGQGTAASPTFTVTPPPAPVITGFWPRTGAPGTVVHVQGQNLTYEGQSIAAIGGADERPIPWVDPTEVTLFSGIHSGRITIATPGGTATSSAEFLALPLQRATGPQAVTLERARVEGGTSVRGTVSLGGTAPEDGTSVALSSSNPAARVPASVPIGQFQSNGEFTVTTSPVETDQAVTITATWNGASVSVTLTVAAPPDLDAPAWPPGATLSASPLEFYGASLSWPAATDNRGVTGYRVYQDGGLIASPDAGGTSLTLRNLRPETGYDFRVEAGDAAGNWSAALSAQVRTGPVPDLTPPDWPDGAVLTAADLEADSVRLSWLEPPGGTRSFRVYQDGVLLATQSATFLDVTGLTSSTAYTFKVEAGDAAGNWTQDGPSATVTTLAAGETQAPTWTVDKNLSPFTVAHNSLNLSWSGAQDNVGVTRYKVYVNGVAEPETAGTFYTVMGLSPSTSYTFKVEAGDAAGNWSTDGPTAAETTAAAPDF